jgi:hypothetical protein
MVRSIEMFKKSNSSTRDVLLERTMNKYIATGMESLNIRIQNKRKRPLLAVMVKRLG